MTDREWPEYPNQSGGETVTGQRSAQEEAASERGWEGRIRRPPLQRRCQSEEGSNWERTAQDGTGRSPRRSARGRFGNAGPGAGAPGGRAFLPGEGSEPSQTTETSGWKPGMDPQRIAERNRICPPNLRNRPARSSKRLRLSLRRNPGAVSNGKRMGAWSRAPGES